MQRVADVLMSPLVIAIGVIGAVIGVLDDAFRGARDWWCGP